MLILKKFKDRHYFYLQTSKQNIVLFELNVVAFLMYLNWRKLQIKRYNLLTIGISLSFLRKNFKNVYALRYSVHISWWRSHGYVNLRYLKRCQVKFPKTPKDFLNIDMEYRYTKNFNGRQNSSVLPIILYLTLPTVAHHGRFEDIQNVKRTKSKKLQQRDQNRLNTFIERKSVWSELPFYSLDNAEIKIMASEQIPAKKLKIFTLNWQN